MMRMAAITAKGLTKRYGRLEALRGLDLTVEEGEAFGLIGPNGSGKTTAIGILAGSLAPTAGTATVLGIDVSADPIGVKRKIGIVPEMEYPPSFLTVREYLDLVCSLRGVPDPKPKVDRWIGFFGLGAQEDALCKDLSKGTKKKVMLSAAFVHGPRLLVLDEPFLDLDPIVQRNTREYLRSYVEGGGTLFLSTHILELAEKVCGRVGILYEGRLIASGRLSDLRQSRESLEDVFMRLVPEAP